MLSYVRMYRDTDSPTSTHTHTHIHIHTHMHTFIHTHIHVAWPVCSMPGHMALLRLDGASKDESSSFAGVSDSNSLFSLHLCTAIVLLCYRTISGTCYTAKHLSVLLLAWLSQPSTYASSCHRSYGKFYHTPCTPQSHSLPA